METVIYKGERITRGYLRDMIENTELARDDAKKAKHDDIYAIRFPYEYDGLDSFISECDRQIKEMETVLYQD